MKLQTALFAIVLGCCLFTGCGLDKKGMVLFTDPAYSASVIGTERDGFTVPDGLLWRQGRLYIADEGGAAFRIWTSAGHSVTLCDAKSGVISPEDMTVDNSGNIYFTDDDTGGVVEDQQSGRG